MSYENMFTPNYVDVIDPILDNQPKLLFPLIKGGCETTERTYTTSSHSESSTQFSVPPPNPSTFVSRRILLKMKVVVTFHDDDNGAADFGIFQTGFYAPRQAPLHSVMETLDLIINGQSTTIQMADVVHPLLLFNNSTQITNLNQSMSPMFADQAQNYSDLCTAIAAKPFQSGRNPLAGGAGNVGGGTPRIYRRGEFPFAITTAPDRTDAVLEYFFTEELMISPLLFGGVRDQGFIGINKMEINFNWSSGLQQLYSAVYPTSTPRGATAGALLITPTFPNDPELMFKYVTPPLNYQMPRFNQYSYNEINRYVSTGGALAAGATATYNTNNIQINCIPRYIYIFVRKRKQDQEVVDANNYCEIKKLSINWNNSNALLANASQEALYDISRRNGFTQGWPSWSAGLIHQFLGAPATAVTQFSYRGLGSVVCLELGIDIGLRPGECPGQVGTYNLQVQVTCINREPGPINEDVYIITSTPGIFTIYDMAASKRIGIVNPSAVNTSHAKMSYDALEKTLMAGGIRWKKMFRKAHKIASVAKKFLPAPYQQYADIGLGLTKGLVKKSDAQRRVNIPGTAKYIARQKALAAQKKSGSGRRKRKGGKKKGTVSKNIGRGGKKLTKKQLVNLLLK